MLLKIYYNLQDEVLIKRNPRNLLYVNHETFFSLQIQTFNVDASCQTVEDLTNGVVMAQVLQKM